MKTAALLSIAAFICCLELAIGSPYPYPYNERPSMESRYGYSRFEPKFPEEAFLQGTALRTDTSYRLLHQHCDDRGSLHPRQRYFLKMPEGRNDRWGVSNCETCQSTSIHFSNKIGGVIKSGDPVEIIAKNDRELVCDSQKCPAEYRGDEFTIYSCGSRVGDKIYENDGVMLYIKKPKQYKVSFNRADPFLYYHGNPLSTPPTDNDCDNSCGTVVFVLSA